MMRLAGGVVAAVALGLLAGCAPGPQQPAVAEPYLVVWAGDADRRDSDFLAVIDASPTSTTYGKVLRTIPVRSRGNEPHGLDGASRADRRVFATGVATGRTFVFDLRDPLAGRLLHVDEPGPGRRLGAPWAVAPLPDGRVAVTCVDRLGYRGDPRGLLQEAGGLVELDADGSFRREVSADPGPGYTMIVAPTGAAVVPALGLLLTTNHAHGYVPTATGDVMPGISVQLWRVESLALLRTVVLEAGPRGEENLGPLTPVAFHRAPLVYVNTHEGGGLYASDSLGQAQPVFRMVFDFGTGAGAAGAAVTPDDAWYVSALTGRNRVASFDVGDPWHPKLVSALRFDRDPADPLKARVGGPSALAMSADGTRVAVADDAVELPAEQRDGDHRVYVLRLDPATGRLRFDTAFRDETTGEVGVDFDRPRWPHGETGPARPYGVLFVTPAPPPADGRR
ncbi:MAG TPA: hypothetical protein VKW76_07545 [Candidatus Binatia bacterium]|nr:hypothetical protein [Candidatus Binatia bacterium]